MTRKRGSALARRIPGRGEPIGQPRGLGPLAAAAAGERLLRAGARPARDAASGPAV